MSAHSTLLTLREIIVEEAFALWFCDVGFLDCTLFAQVTCIFSYLHCRQRWGRQKAGLLGT